MAHTNEERMIEVGPHRVAYRRTGTGPDLLWLHGWPLHGGTWRNITPHLEADYTCHVIDLPGTGNTRSAPGTRLAVDLNLGTVLGVIDALGLKRYGLIGNNSGGMLAREIAAKRVEQVSALVITGSEIPGHASGEIKRLKLLSRLPGIGPVLSVMLRNRWLRRSRLGLSTCFMDMRASDGDFAETMLEPFRHRQVRDGQLELLRNFDTSHVDVLFDVHPLITAPTLMVWGGRDPFFPVRKAQAMAEQFGGAVRFEVIPDAKLLVHEEHPARFAELTKDFLAEVQPVAP